MDNWHRRAEGVEQTPLKWEKWATHILLECFLVMTYGLPALLDPLLTGCRGWRFRLKRGRGRGESAYRGRGLGQTPLQNQKIGRLRILLECCFVESFFRKKSLKSVYCVKLQLIVCCHLMSEIKTLNGRILITDGPGRLGE